MKHYSITVAGMKVDMVQIPQVIEMMEEWIVNKSYGQDIVISNANDAVVCKNDFRVRKAVLESSLSVPDGISLVLLGRLHGYDLKKRVYGPELMLEFIGDSQKKGFSHFFYGATPKTLERLKEALKVRFPLIRIAGSYAPPFGLMSAEEDEKVVRLINESRADVLWVGLGCPKQQLWMHDHKDRLRVPVMVGVGAAFDFLAGVKPQAPRWMRDHGFEWLFRLACEPKRLWKRYLLGNPAFVYYVVMELLRNRFKKDHRSGHV